MKKFLRSKLTLVLVVVAMLFGVAATLSMIVPAKAADTGGYPNYNMPCEHYPYATNGTGYWCKNYDWGPVHTEKYDDPSEYSSRGYSYRNCTDFVAWKVASLGVSPAQYKGLGKAKDWPTNAPSKGLTVNTTPAIGAAAVDTSGSFGHVAFISAYNSSTGIITVQEYNKWQDGNYVRPFRSGTLAGLGFSKVVHFEKYETSGSSGGGTVSKPGDCNGDGHVNVIDLSILLSHYGQAYGPCDFNHDGIVNIIDLSILESHYGT